MCGFLAQAGVLYRDNFIQAAKLVDHRGVRSQTMSHSGGVVHHARLPIVGTDAQYDQPVRRVASGREWLIAFVGEILDFRERHPKMQCDTELVTRAWLQRGPRGLVDYDGFWSVAALSDDRTLHLLTDYLGQKPIYYRQDVRVAASEPDAVAALAPVTPDEVYLSACIKWGYCPEVERTPYREVKRTLPGEHVVILPDGEVKRWIVDPLEPAPMDRDELKREIEDAVRRRVLSSDVPVACLLSGGLDSSIVYTLARRYGNPRAYYVAGESLDLEEAAAVSAVAGKDKVTEAYDYRTVKSSEALEIMQEPIDLGSLVPQVVLSRAVSETVCLTGDGADEAFGGYGRSERYDSQYSDLLQELPCWHLPRLDRVMMRNRTEVRSPFLARRVVRGALALPWSHRKDKLLLRHMFRDDLPPGIAFRKKKPLRTSAVETNREENSRLLVEMFRRRVWPEDRGEELLRVIRDRR